LGKVTVAAVPTAAAVYQFYYVPALAAAAAALPPPPLRRTPPFVGGDEPLGDLIGDQSVVLFLARVAVRAVAILLRSLPVLVQAWRASRPAAGARERAEFYAALTALFTALGPSFIKLGQWIATRPDIVPVELCAALSVLFDKAPAHSAAETNRVLARSGVMQHLESVAPEPISSGSIAQVHRAVLRTDYVVDATDRGTLAAMQIAPPASAALPADGGGGVVAVPAGTAVVVKVMHPGLRQLLVVDLYLLRQLSRLLEWAAPSSRYLSPQQTVQEFGAMLISQLDFAREGDNLLQFCYNFRGDPAIVFPRPLNGLSTAEVLVETFEAGESLVGAGPIADVGRLAVRAFMKMLFEDNFIHADLHPGNLLHRVLHPDGTVSVRQRAAAGDADRVGAFAAIAPGDVCQLVGLDVGLVTSLSVRERAGFMAIFTSIVVGDGALGAHALLKLAPEEACGDVRRFEAEIQHCVDQFKVRTGTFGDVDISQVLANVMATMRSNQVRVEMNFATILGTFALTEALGRLLTPDTNIFLASVPFLSQCLDTMELVELAQLVKESHF
jgi:aarF domain-containing kinase